MGCDRMKPMRWVLWVVVLGGSLIADSRKESLEGGRRIFLGKNEEMEKCLSLLKKQLREGNWPGVASSSLKLIEKFAEGDVGVDDSLYLSGAEYARRLLSRYPEALKEYRRVHDKSAREVLEKLRKSPSFEGVEKALSSYPLSSYQKDFLRLGASLAMDKGEFDFALMYLEKLSGLELEEREKEIVEVMRAVCLAKLGALDLARSVARKLETVKVGGQVMSRDQIEKLLERVGVDEREAPVKGVGTSLWKVTLPTGLSDRLWRPQVRNGVVFLPTSNWLGAISLWTGEWLWAHPDYPFASATRRFGEEPRRVAVMGEMVFASVGRRMVCLDRRTGKVVWFYEFEGKKQGEEKGRSVLSSPTLAPGRVAVAEMRLVAEKPAECLVHLFDARSGKLSKSVFLCERDVKGVVGVGTTPGRPLFFRGRLYIATSIGSLACVNPLTGEQEWSFVYDSYNQHLKTRTIELERRIEGRQVVASLERVLLAPQDSMYLYCIEADSGRLIWRREDIGARFVAGTVRRDFVLVGDRVELVDYENGKVLWESEPLPTVVGEPVLRAGMLWVPTRGGLLQLKVGGDGVERFPEPYEAVVALEDRVILAGKGRVEAYGLVESRARRDFASSIPVLLRKTPAEERQKLFEKAERFLETKSGANRESVLRRWSVSESKELSAWALLRLASTYESAGNVGEALRCYERILRYTGEVKVSLKGVRVEAGVVAEMLIDRLLQKDRSFYEGAEERASVLYRRGKVEELFKLYPNSRWAERAGANLGGKALLRMLSHRSIFYSDLLNRALEKQPALLASLKLVWQTPTKLSVIRARPLRENFGGRVIIAIRERDFIGGGAEFSAVQCRELETGLVAWEAKLGEWTGQALRLGDSILLRGRYGVEARRLENGILLWSRQFRGGKLVEVRSAEPAEPDRLIALTGDEQRVYLTSEGGAVGALSPEGKLLWQRTLGSAPRADGTFCWKGVLCVISKDEIVSFDSGTGELLWRREMKEPPSAFTPSRDGKLALMSKQWLRAFAFEDGSLLWELQLPRGLKSLLSFGKKLLVIPERYAPNPQIMCTDWQTGSVHWRRTVQTGSLRNVSAGDGIFLLRRSFGRRYLVRLSENEGLAEWESIGLNFIDTAQPATGRGVVVLIGEQNRELVAIVLDSRTGKLLDWIHLKGAYSGYSAVIDDKLIIATNRGTFTYSNHVPQRSVRRLIESDKPEVVANCASRLGQPETAVKVLERALSDSSIPETRFVALEDTVAGIKESIVRKAPPRLVAMKLPSPPVIDGILSEEWDERSSVELRGIRYIEEVDYGIPRRRTWLGENDLSGKLYVGWDEKNFYFALNVRDTILRPMRGEEQEWVGDGLLISIDCDNDGGFGFSFGRDLLLTLGLTIKPKPQRKDQIPKGNYAVERKEDNSGTVYEVAIPWSYIKWIQPKHKTVFGFNVTVTDDDGQKVLKVLNWTPGLFFYRRVPLLERGYTPEYFGDVVLWDPLKER